MSMVSVILPDGSTKEVRRGTTFADLAALIGPGLQRHAVGGRINGQLVDLAASIEQSASVEVVTIDDPAGLSMLRHSTAHLLAQALKRVYGADRVKLGIGPVISDGFYYDVELHHSITVQDLSSIEAEMRKIAEEDLFIRRVPVSRAEAAARFAALDEPYKLELIHDLPADAEITLYEQGEFVDLCRGPHVPSTGWIKSFRLLSVGGAYWRGDARNPMLQRIYGTAFASRAELEEHLGLLEEAKKRDHRKLGRELELFMFSEDAPGMPFYLPNGLIVRNLLEDYERSLQVSDYQEVRTPILMNQRLWEQSGHWAHYHENMYFSKVDDVTFALKPMSCPGHMLIYKNKLHSYRDLPIRMSEYGHCHRNELSGALNGMLRVRSFTQDDAHMFVRPDQIEAELHGVLSLVDKIYGTFGFKYHLELSTRPENSMGSDELWDQAEQALKNVLDRAGVPYRINEGDGAFYGPKIDCHIEDALKRSWQCATIQLDFQLPERFDLSYVGEDNQKHRPVVIHRAIFGSIDRFLGILTEHFAGAFPLWLAPVQVVLLPISSQHQAYALQLLRQLRDSGFRAEVDDRDEKVGYRIREAEVRKVPYTFVIGDKEVQSGSVAVRKRGVGDQGPVPSEEMLKTIEDEVRSRLL